MAQVSRTITTLDELTSEEFPVLRLRHTPPAASSVFDLRGIAGFFSRSTAEVQENVELVADEETTRKNQERLSRIFADLRAKMDEQEKNAMDKMKNMTAGQQEQMIGFWSVVNEWMMDVINWIKKLSDRVWQLIKQGFKIIKEAFVAAFKMISEQIKKIM